MNALILFITIVSCTIRCTYGDSQIFKCQNTEFCKCLGTTSDAEDILCSQDGGLKNPVFLIDVRSKEFVKIQCQSIAESSSYNILPDLTIGELQYVNFKMCPLPQDKSLLDIINSLGVTKFKRLIFQSYNRNLSTELMSKHFAGLTELNEIILSSNGLTNLPQDLFSDFTNLTSLDLRSNNIKLSSGIFDSLTKLKYLELGHNDIQDLSEGIFKNLNELTQLNLWQNAIQHISKGAFEGLVHLKALDLSANKLEALDVGVFNDLPSLTILHMNSNNLSTLPAKLFETNRNLTTVKFSLNKNMNMVLEDHLFANLSYLSNVSLDRCRLKSIPDNLFTNSKNLTNIDISYNSLTSLSDILFKDLINLKVLLIHHNNLTFIPNKLFISLSSLEILDLSFNGIDNISEDLFSGLKNLKNLNMANNKLQLIDYNAFSRTNNLVSINLANNLLSFSLPTFDDSYGSYSPFKNLPMVKYLNLANNSLINIFADWRLSLLTLKNLDLSHNRIKDVSIHGNLHFLSNNIVVDLRHNLISRIDLVKAEQMAMQKSNDQVNGKDVVKILLDDNPLHCDCSAYHFVKYLDGTLNPNVNKMVQLVANNLSCVSPPQLKGVQISKVDPKLLVCSLDHPESATKHCPKECNCDVRIFDTALIVNCSYADLMDVPPLVNLSASKLNFTELYIQGNHLSSLPNMSHIGYTYVRKINAEFNNISELSLNNIPPHIEVLQLAHNNLSFISSSVFKALRNKTKIQKLTLGSNPWMCNCFSTELLSYMQSNYQTVEGLQNITCFGKKWSELSTGELCPFQNTVIVSISILIAILGLLLGALAALYYYYQQEIKVWLFAHNFCLWFVTEEELDKDKIFDAFISYSHKDEDFVTDQLVPNLEGGDNPFKLCLHYRDWIAGEWIPTQIARSVEDSKRTVVILSANFLESVWGKMEFRTAHNNALTEGRARVIIIIYGDIGPLDNLDAELKAYLSTNTYLEWGDPWFWDKLRYALPHPPKVKGKRLTNSNKQNGLFDDKVDLIHPIAKTNGANSPIMQNGDIKLNGIVNNGFFTGAINGSAKQSDV